MREPEMTGFGEAVSEFFSRAFEFHGRSTRAAYWWVQLFFLLINSAFIFAIVFSALDSSGGAAPTTMFATVLVAFIAITLICILPQLSLTIRRLHDSGKSGWWYLISFVPFGSLLLLIFVLLPGDEGPNEHGPDPYGRGSVSYTFS